MRQTWQLESVLRGQRDVDRESRSLHLHVISRHCLIYQVRVKVRGSTEQMLRVRIASARRVLATRLSIRAVQSSACRRNESVDLNSVERVSDDVDVFIAG